MIDLSILYLVVPLVLGVLLGFLLRGKKSVELGKATVAVIVVLIFSLGFGIGSDSELLNALPRVGFNAVVVCLLAVGFSVVLVKAARKAAGIQ